MDKYIRLRQFKGLNNFYASFLAAGYKAKDACFNANTAGDKFGNCGKDKNDVAIKCAKE